MVPYCIFSVHIAANMYKREIPHLYSGDTIFAMCPLDPEGGGSGRLDYDTCIEYRYRLDACLYPITGNNSECSVGQR